MPSAECLIFIFNSTFAETIADDNERPLLAIALTKVRAIFSATRHLLVTSAAVYNFVPDGAR